VSARESSGFNDDALTHNFLCHITTVMQLVAEGQCHTKGAIARSKRAAVVGSSHSTAVKNSANTHMHPIHTECGYRLSPCLHSTSMETVA
jgi:hypothetical protein